MACALDLRGGAAGAAVVLGPAARVRLNRRPEPTVGARAAARRDRVVTLRPEAQQRDLLVGVGRGEDEARVRC